MDAETTKLIIQEVINYVLDEDTLENLEGTLGKEFILVAGGRLEQISTADSGGGFDWDTAEYSEYKMYYGNPLDVIVHLIQQDDFYGSFMHHAEVIPLEKYTNESISLSGMSVNSVEGANVTFNVEPVPKYEEIDQIRTKAGFLSAARTLYKHSADKKINKLF